MRFKEDVMRSLRLSRAWLFCALLTSLLLATVGASGRNGRDFTGYFNLSGVQEQGDLIQVTLHLRLFNHSNTDLSSVVVTLLDSAPALDFRGNFAPVKVWKKQQFIEMSREFTVSKLEFKQWAQAPAQPNLVILFQDNTGKTWQEGAQISRREIAK